MAAFCESVSTSVITKDFVSWVSQCSSPVTRNLCHEPGWPPSTTYFHLSWMPRDPTQRSPASLGTMSNSWETPLERGCCGTGRLITSPEPQRPFVSADTSGMFLLKLSRARRKWALKHNAHWNWLSSGGFRGVSAAWWCAFHLRLRSPDAFPLFVPEGWMAAPWSRHTLY